MRSAKRRSKKKNIVLRVACAAFATYMVVQIVSLQIQLRDRRQELNTLNAEIHRQELLNEALKDKNENTDIHLEEEARDHGYYLPGEQIYIPEN